MSTSVRDPATRTTYRLEGTRPLAEGGEACVFGVMDHPGLVAKIYKEPRPERASKLEFMIANPPVNPTASENHLAYAWPTTLLTSSTGSDVIGFMMPRVKEMKEVFTVYNPGTRKQLCAGRFDYRYLTQTARNIAWVMAELHSKGYLIADVSQKNVLVTSGGLVTVLDTDSFEFRDPKTDFLHLCKVRTPGFIAPEGYAASQDDPRAVEEDRFALAVMVFHLLMEGVHPFACRFTGEGEAPRLQQNVVSGNFPYKTPADQLYQPMPAAPPFTMLPPDVQALFVQCFVAGHRNPAARPSAKDWQKALTDASKNLVKCANPKRKHHYYFKHLGSDCPWCARVARGLPEPFPNDEDLKVPPAAPGAKTEPRKPKTSSAKTRAPKSAPTPTPAPASEPKSKVGLLVLFVIVVVALLRLIFG